MSLAALLSQSVVEHEPLFPSADKPIRIIFFADRGTKGLMGFTGDVYAHTGLITSKSTSPSDWKYVKTYYFSKSTLEHVNMMVKEVIACRQY